MLQVGEVDDGVLATEERGGVGDHPGDHVGGGHVGVEDQLVEPELDTRQPRRPVGGRGPWVHRNVAVVWGHVEGAYEKSPATDVPHCRRPVRRQ